jgi:predicted DNA-binding transcriptional regulator YafY
MDVEPWAVVVRHGRWYLVCRSLTADALRAYRVDRVRSVEVLPDTFTPAPDLDPVALLEEHLALGWEYDVEVVVQAPLAEARRCVPRGLGRLEAQGENATRVLGSTSNPRWYAAQLASVPHAFRVVGGPEIQTAVSELAQRLTEAAAAAAPHGSSARPPR